MLIIVHCLITTFSSKWCVWCSCDSSATRNTFMLLFAYFNCLNLNRLACESENTCHPLTAAPSWAFYCAVKEMCHSWRKQRHNIIWPFWTLFHHSKCYPEHCPSIPNTFTPLWTPFYSLKTPFLYSKYNSEVHSTIPDGHNFLSMFQKLWAPFYHSEYYKAIRTTIALLRVPFHYSKRHSEHNSTVFITILDTISDTISQFPKAIPPFWLPFQHPDNQSTILNTLTGLNPCPPFRTSPHS